MSQHLEQSLAHRSFQKVLVDIAFSQQTALGEDQVLESLELRTVTNMK